MQSVCPVPDTEAGVEGQELLPGDSILALHHGQGVVLPQLVELCVDEHPAVVEHDDPIGESLHVGHVVRGEENRGAAFVEQPDRGLQKLASGRRVQAASGLIEDQQLGTVGDAQSRAT